jgi:hypothetical protein
LDDFTVLRTAAIEAGTSDFSSRPSSYLLEDSILERSITNELPAPPWKSASIPLVN